MYKRSAAILFVILLATATFGVEGDQVQYVAGSINTATPGELGKLDISNVSALRFTSTGGTISIPYKSVTSYRVEKQVAHHLGVLPAIAVGLVK